LTITNAQNRQAHCPKTVWCAGRSFARYAIGAAGQDHGFWREIGQKGIRDGLIGVNFAVNIQLAQAARDQLRHLAAKVDDQQAFVCGVFHVAS